MLHGIVLKKVDKKSKTVSKADGRMLGVNMEV
jgi:hypothetical protein